MVKPLEAAKPGGAIARVRSPMYVGQVAGAQIAEIPCGVAFRFLFGIFQIAGVLHGYFQFVIYVEDDGQVAKTIDFREQPEVGIGDVHVRLVSIPDYGPTGSGAGAHRSCSVGLRTLLPVMTKGKDIRRQYGKGYVGERFREGQAQVTAYPPFRSY